MRPYWIYPSSYQSRSVVLAVAAATLPESHVRRAGLGGEGADPLSQQAGHV